MLVLLGSIVELKRANLPGCRGPRRKKHTSHPIRRQAVPYAAMLATPHF